MKTAYGIEPRKPPLPTRAARRKTVIVTGSPKKFADGGFVDSMKKAVGMGPKKSLFEQEMEKAKAKAAAPAEKPKEAPTAKPAEDTTNRRKQIDAALTRAGG